MARRINALWRDYIAPPLAGKLGLVQKQPLLLSRQSFQELRVNPAEAPVAENADHIAALRAPGQVVHNRLDVRQV